MALRDWLQKFVTVGALAWGIEIAVATPAVAQPPATGEVPRLPDVNVVAEPPAPSVNLQPNFEPFAQDSIVTENSFKAPPTTGYNAPSSTIGSLIPIPDLRFPGTISTVTPQVRQDQQAYNFSDILRDIGAAVQTNNDNLRPDSFFLRGFEVTSYSFRKNGFLDNTYTPRDFANVERVDVLKGPASVLYGVSQPGGVVNVVTKKAQQDRFANGYWTFGSYEMNRFAVDVNSTNQAGDILYRVNAAYQDNNSFRQSYYNERTFVSPTVTFLLDEDTILTVEGEYHYDRRMFDTGIIAVGGNTRAMPINRHFGDDNDFQQFHDYRAQITLTHQFSDQWAFYMGGQTLFYDAPSRALIPQTGAGSVLDANGFFTGGTVDRSFSTAQAFAEQNHALISNITGEFNTGRFVHHSVSGVEADWFVVNHDQFATSIPGFDNPETINPFAPGPYASTPTTSSFVFNNPGFRQNRLGLYTQDIIDLTERWKFFGSARWDTVNQTYNRETTFAGFQTFPGTGNIYSTHDTFNRWSPRAGLMYEIVPGAMTAYGSYTRSFSPPGGGNFGFQTFQPEIGHQWEGGIKTNIYEDLTFTVAGFWIDRTNVSTLVTNVPLTFAQSGLQRSQGVEMNLTGNWTDRLSTVTNYTYNDITQTGAPTVPSINGRVRGVPLSMANMWTRFNLIQDRERTFGVGLGYVYVGDRRGDYGTPLILPSYGRCDAGVFGRWGRWNMTTYIENIFDVRYSTGSINQYQVYQGAPVNFRMQVGATF